MRPAFRLAIVGAGLITQNAHLPTALSLPGVKVVALVDPVLDRATRLVADYGLDAFVAQRGDALIGQVDGVVIATPNHTHAEIAVPLLEAGISTFIEKPIATTVADAQAIVAAAKRGNARVAIGHYQRFLDAPRLLKRLLDQKHFGRVTRFYHQFGSAGGWPALSAYTLKREYIGGGVLVVTGTHFLDRMLHLWGMPDEVSLRDDAGTGPESHCEGRVRYTDVDGMPLEGLVRYSKCVPLPAGLVLETERGIVMLKDGEDDRITLLHGDGSSGAVGSHHAGDLRSELVSTPDASFPRGMDANQRMLWDFVQACQQLRAPCVDGEQGVALLQLLDRFYARREPLPDRWTEFASPPGAAADAADVASTTGVAA